MTKIKTCAKCILDSNDDPEITFDEKGVCTYCNIYDANILKYYYGNDSELKMFNRIIFEIKEKGKGKKYDAIIGLSGGVDSTYVAYLCYQYNLRILAVHIDNGWNSEISAINIKNILKKTKYDLYTYVINWAEFRDIQKSYFKANVIDIEAISDHAISSVLRKVAIKENIKFILSGTSITTEGRLPKPWVFMKLDSLNIKAIHKRYGSMKMKTYPIQGYLYRILKDKIYGIKSIDILNYVNYVKTEAKELIKKEFYWKDYGGKHYESVFTRFYQAYILPEKFNVDKRKSHYSTLICANQMTRAQALVLMQEPLYASELLKKQDKEYVLKKLGFSSDQFDEYLKQKQISHLKYPSIVKYLLFLSKIKRTIKFWKKM
ncbi:MAG: hypothetical protein A2W98_04900 [Bacteroidetes bacterium GWF2_33_38]|nr:MAG: hypothetical protein A2W98_04900 [Bacteroidetes bacterium GWF2_33_38]